METLTDLESKNKPEIKLAVFDRENSLYTFSCPHCDLPIEVERSQINCSIFRHGYFFEKTSDGKIILSTQMNPHTPKDICDKLYKEGKIYGCGKPFRMVRKGGDYGVEICEYI